ncbi:NAD(P)-binding protein [Imleria badia]|nr:NAD(P)-binding protein [Imleria badia]
MSARNVTVFGATGKQGSSVVRALLDDGTFTPRAVTRNANSEKAQKLKQLGAEVVEGDLWDVASLKNAMKGSEGVFGVTDYYDPKNLAQGETSETLMGKHLVDAATEADVKLFVWSSLPNCAKASYGKYSNVYHFDNKANVDDYLRDGVLPYAILRLGWFLENTQNFNLLTPTPDSSSYELTIPKFDPKSPQYFIWVERDLGQCVLALLKNYKDDSAHVLGEAFYAVGERMSYTDYAKEIEKAVGKPVRFVSGAATGMEEVDEMYGFQNEFGFYPAQTVIPDPRLERFGVKFHSNETFAKEELKKRYA